MKKAMLVILDGYGHRTEAQYNAIAAARKPFIDHLMQTSPNGLLHTSGRHVGLPDGQMGNSEVGHVNIGAGRVVYQDSVRINKAIEDRDFFHNPVLLDAIQRVKSSGNTLHICGLLSDGGVHSHIDHLFALLDFIAEHKLENTRIHAFMDGRDTAPTSGLGFAEQLNQKLAETGYGKIASCGGRYFGMDRDQRWDRVKQAINAMRGQSDFKYESIVAGIREAYDANISDEFIQPFVIIEDGQAVGAIQDGDMMLCINLRADRVRQLSRVFADPDFSAFERDFQPIDFVQFTEYDVNFPLPTVFEKQSLSNTLGEVVSAHGGRQLRCAETEKYAHVTFFMNGGDDIVFAGEDRKMVASPSVATYDLQPEMSAPEVTDILVSAVESSEYDMVIANYANPDMVGHTGDFDAAVKAIETVDECLSRLIPVAREHGFQILITADHGNSELMWNEDTNQPFTQHTTGPVPVIFLGDQAVRIREEGSLQDLAPTMLSMMQINIPDVMTGQSLLIPEEIHENALAD